MKIHELILTKKFDCVSFLFSVEIVFSGKMFSGEVFSGEVSISDLTVLITSEVSEVSDFSNNAVLRFVLAV